MKNVSKVFGIITLVSIIGFSAVSCATASSIGSSTGPHGFFTGNGASSAAVTNSAEISSYSVILTLFDAGYAKYAAAVKAAEAEGKKIVSVTKWFVFFTKTTAYAQ